MQHASLTSNLFSRQQTASDADITPTRQNLQGGTFTLLMTWLVAVLSSGALLSSGYLAWVSLTGSKVLGCDGGVFDCGHVLTSRWSEVLGIPVGVLAVLVYTLMLLSVGCTRSSNPIVQIWALRSLWLLSMTAAFAAMWFITLQVTSIGRLCPYCLLVHGCGIALAALIAWRVSLGRVMSVKLTSVAVLMVATLIVGQFLSPVPETFIIEQNTAPAAEIQSDGGEVFEAPVMIEAPIDEATPANPAAADRQSLLHAVSLQSFASLTRLNPGILLSSVMMAPQEASNGAPTTKTKPERKLVPVFGGTKTLDANQWPLWGNASADHIVVEMFDYTCSHCRNTHKAIRDASNQLGGNFAVIALPVPLHRDCNDAATSSSPERAHACEIARIAVAVWLADRAKFTVFHDWLFAQERTAAQARVHAEQLVGQQVMQEQLAKPTASAYISRNVELYKQAGSGTVPKIIFPSKTLVGEVSSGGTIADLIRR